MKYDLNEIYDWPFIPKIGVIGLLCLIILYLGYFYDFSDQIKKRNRLIQQENDLIIQYGSLATNASTLKQELSQYSLVAQSVKSLKKNIISPAELTELINEILKIGRKNNLEFMKFDPVPEMKLDPYLKVLIKTQVIGSYNQIANFISEVANMNKIIVVSDFIISKYTPKSHVPEQSQDNRLISDLNIEIYEVKE